MRHWLACCLFLPTLAWGDTPPEQVAKKALEIYETQLAEAGRLADRALRDAKNQKDQVGQAWALLALGAVKRQKGVFDSAFFLTEAARVQFTLLKAPREVAKAQLQAGSIKSQASSFVQAEELLRGAQAMFLELAPRSDELGETYRELGVNYLRRQLFGQSLVMLDSARMLFEQTGNRLSLARTLNNLGLCHRNMGNLAEALKQYYLALDVYESLNRPNRQMAVLLTNLANINQQLGDTTAQSIDSLYQRANRIAQQLRDTSQLVGMAYSISGNLILKGRYAEAVERVLLARGVAQATGLRVEDANLANQLGVLHRLQKKFGEAYVYFEEAVRLYQKASEPKFAINPYTEWAQTLLAEKRYADALLKGKEALAIKQGNADFRFAVPRLRFSLAECYLYTGRLDSARQLTEDLLAEGQQSNRRATVLSAYKLFQRLDSAAGNGQGELVWLKKYLLLQDSIGKTEKTQAQQNTRITQEIKELQRVNELRATEARANRVTKWAGIIVLTILSVLMFTLYQSRAQKQRSNRELARKNDEISQQNEEISQQNEDLVAKNDTLEALNKEKTNLVRIVTHDLRAPLGNISTIAKLALDEPSPPPEQVALIHQIAEDALVTVAQLLNWQAATRSDFVLHPEPLDAAELLVSVAGQFETEAARKSITLHLPTERQDKWALGDRNFVRKILENLISNAIKFSFSGKAIYLGVREGIDAVTISVRDEGPGIRPEDMPKLFGQFQQLSARPTAGEASSGLGLYIAKRYAEAMGGGIGCESIPGQGATFSLRLGRP
jgi:signal transduction histidine kinase